MAALSRPSLRSTSQRSAGVELSATGIQRKPSTDITKNGKRTRDAALLDGDNRSSKKQKTGDLEVPRHYVARGHYANCFVPPTDKPPKSVRSKDLTRHTATPEQARKDVASIGTSTVDDGNTPNGNVNGNADQPRISVVARKVDKRSLRSQDGGSRSKSELALYFPNYDELVSIEPKSTGMIRNNGFISRLHLLIVPEFLTINTLVLITDESDRLAASDLVPLTSHGPMINNQNSMVKRLGASLNDSLQSSEEFEKDSKKLNEAQRIDFSSILGSTTLPQEDPMADAIYLKAHRRAERQEKQLRNIEKERAQHEKVQLERLLDGLKGHDWLRVMGISGITDTEKKLYEPKREYLIHEVESLLEKFRVWKEEEKRRKLEKEQKAEGDEDQSEASDGESPDYSDVDAWAARQLHREASSANDAKIGKRRSHRPQPTDEVPWRVEKPFTSFFAKPYMREAALGKHRRGRTTVAFGHPLPDVREQEFGLPSDLLTQDALNASARRSRRANRESKENREKPN